MYAGACRTQSRRDPPSNAVVNPAASLAATTGAALAGAGTRALDGNRAVVAVGVGEARSSVAEPNLAAED